MTGGRDDVGGNPLESGVNVVKVAGSAQARWGNGFAKTDPAPMYSKGRGWSAKSAWLSVCIDGITCDCDDI